jgi:hypothetical protein
MEPPEPGPASDLDRLRADHPQWVISTAWVTRASGPDARRLVATREGARVGAWTWAELSARITGAEAEHGW